MLSLNENMFFGPTFFNYTTRIAYITFKIWPFDLNPRPLCYELAILTMATDLMFSKFYKTKINVKRNNYIL